MNYTIYLFFALTLFLCGKDEAKLTDSLESELKSNQFFTNPAEGIKFSQRSVGCHSEQKPDGDILGLSKSDLFKEAGNGNTKAILELYRISHTLPIDEEGAVMRLLAIHRGYFTQYLMFLVDYGGSNEGFKEDKIIIDKEIIKLKAESAKGGLESALKLLLVNYSLIVTSRFSDDDSYLKKENDICLKVIEKTSSRDDFSNLIFNLYQKTGSPSPDKWTAQSKIPRSNSKVGGYSKELNLLNGKLAEMSRKHEEAQAKKRSKEEKAAPQSKP